MGSFFAYKQTEAPSLFFFPYTKTESHSLSFCMHIDRRSSSSLLYTKTKAPSLYTNKQKLLLFLLYADRQKLILSFFLCTETEAPSLYTSKKKLPLFFFVYIRREAPSLATFHWVRT